MEADFRETEAEAIADHQALVEDLIAYARQHFKLELAPADADAALLSWTEQHSFGLLQKRFDEVRRITSRAQIDVVVAGFIVELHQRGLAGLDRLEKVARGVMLYNLLYLPDPGSSSRSFKGTEVFLDTRLLLRAIGLSGDVMQRPIRELLVLIRESGGHARCFDHTADEMRGILHALAMQMQDGIDEIYGESQDFLAEQNLSPSDVAEIAETLESRLREIDVMVEDAPRQADYLIAEERLEALLQEAVPRYRYQALRADVKSLRAIHTLRQGKVFSRLEDTPAVFVTTNVAMAKVAAKFFEEEPWMGRAQHCLADHWATTVMWLKRPVKAPTLPRDQVIAHAYAALNPPEDVWTRYRRAARELVETSQLTQDQYVSASVRTAS